MWQKKFQSSSFAFGTFCAVLCSKLHKFRFSSTSSSFLGFLHKNSCKPNWVLPECNQSWKNQWNRCKVYIVLDTTEKLLSWTLKSIKSSLIRKEAKDLGKVWTAATITSNIPGTDDTLQGCPCTGCTSLPAWGVSCRPCGQPQVRPKRRVLLNGAPYPHPWQVLQHCDPNTKTGNLSSKQHQLQSNPLNVITG